VRIVNVRVQEAEMGNLTAIASRMSQGISVKDRRYFLTIYPSCFVGSDAVSWLVQNTRAQSRDEAVLLGRAMVKLGLIRHVEGDHTLKDKTLWYHFTKLVPILSRPVASTKSSSPTRNISATASAWTSSQSLRNMADRAQIERTASSPQFKFSSERVPPSRPSTSPPPLPTPTPQPKFMPDTVVAYAAPIVRETLPFSLWHIPGSRSCRALWLAYELGV
jgi:hypothetical protein